MFAWVVLLAVFVFESSNAIQCQICSHIPDRDLFEASRRLSHANTSNDVDKAIVSSLSDAIEHQNNTDCLQKPYKYVNSCDSLLDTCVKQTIDYNTDSDGVISRRTAVLYSCSKWAKERCVGDQDSDRKWTMCGCKTDNCSKSYEANSSVSSINKNPKSASRDAAVGSDPDKKTRKLVSAVVITLVILTIKCACICVSVCT